MDRRVILLAVLSLVSGMASGQGTTAASTSTVSTASTSSSTVSTASTSSSTVSTAPTNSSTVTHSTSNTTISNTTTAVSSNTNTTTSNSTTTTSSTTTAVPSTTVTTAAAFGLTFSISDTFVSALANSSSPEFSQKATNITNQIAPLYRNAFTNFISIKIISFTNGSIVTVSNLLFSSNTINLTQVQNTFVNGLNNLSFTVDPNSIRVVQTAGNSMPPVITSSLSMIWMSLLSLLLSVTLHV